ncbi:TfpX/TfpZ family type IV pilin accessory protein, partial [Psychrobacter sp. Sarcosine-3u-12]|uniref:TfpX/TfpZ family type IV pilin accessory protein n=1 Tax=Psychrobacter sp. Sarcosine-3u-12 TaxID=2058325 RepID=UPI001D0D6AF8
KATGIGKIFIMILLVDLVLGPLLTFIIYKKNKKTLIVDLTIIILLQLNALGYGVYTVYQARPVWIAYVVDRFELVRANDVFDDYEKKYNLPKLGPKYIYVDLDKMSISEKSELVFREMQYGISPAQLPNFHSDYELAKPLLITRSRSISILNDYNDSADVEAVLNKYPKASSFLPLKSNEMDMTVLIDKNSENPVIKIVDLRPW